MKYKIIGGCNLVALALLLSSSGEKSVVGMDVNNFFGTIRGGGSKEDSDDGGGVEGGVRAMLVSFYRSCATIILHLK